MLFASIMVFSLLPFAVHAEEYSGISDEIGYDSFGNYSLSGIMGDANGDGAVNYQDAVLVLRHAVHLVLLAPEAEARCNVDGVGKLNYQDAVLILRYAVRLIDKFPAEESRDDTHNHQWRDSTCTEPRTCATCGETEGTPLGHSWFIYSCTSPRICGTCGLAETAAPGHSFDSWTAPTQDEWGRWMHTGQCSVCGYRVTEQTDAPVSDPQLGSASKLDETTLIVSIFANDAETAWNFDCESDRSTRALMYLHMGAAMEWIMDCAANYSVDSRFLYDWEKYPDLYYTFDFGDITLVRPDGGGYWTQSSYIVKNIPTQQLMDKYNARNVIYIFYFNTDESNTVNSWSINDRSGVYTEIINIYVRDDYYGGFYFKGASTFAHETLHCFGAPDLYYASERIPQAYVNHCAEIKSNDIMYTIGLGEKITQAFTPLDAYYVGLTDFCEEVDQWGLGKSSHLD